MGGREKGRKGGEVRGAGRGGTLGERAMGGREGRKGGGEVRGGEGK